MEDLGFTPGILDGAIIRIRQLQAEKKANAARDANVPKIPGGCLILGAKVRLSHKLTRIERDPNVWLAYSEIGVHGIICDHGG